MSAMRRHIPWLVSVAVLAGAVAVLQGAYEWGNTATNLAAIGALVICCTVALLTHAFDEPPRFLRR